MSAGTVREAAAADIVAIAVPWASVPAAVAGLQWGDQIVIDPTNSFEPADLGGRTSSEIVAELVPGARLVKAANTLATETLGADPREAGGNRVIFLSGDDDAAKAAVVELFTAAEFFAIDLVSSSRDPTWAVVGAAVGRRRWWRRCLAPAAARHDRFLEFERPARGRARTDRKAAERACSSRGSKLSGCAQAAAADHSADDETPGRPGRTP